MLIAVKRRARALFRHTRLPSHKQIYNDLVNSLKIIVSKNQALLFENRLKKFLTKDGGLWKGTKQALQYKAS